MSIPLTINGVTYSYPEVDDVDWGPDATDWAAAATSGLLQKSGGLFQLLAEVDFGTGFGVKALYFKSRTANTADAGQVRLARADVINWRNEANDANLALSVDAGGVLNWNGAGISQGGTPVQPAITVSDTATIDLSLVSDVLSADIKALSIDNSMVSNSAAIAYSKLALTGSIVNADLANMAQSTIKGRAAGAGTGVPVDLSATQATAILNAFVGDSGSGGTKGLAPAPAAGDAAAGKFLKADGSWVAPSGSGDVVGPASSTSGQIARFGDTTGKLLTATPATISNSDVNASAAIAYSKLALTGSILNADINASAAIAFTKMAAMTINKVPVSDASGFLVATVVSTTELGYLVGVSSAIQTQFSGKLPTTITTTGDLIYSSSGTTASPLAIGTATQMRLKPASGLPAWTYPYSVQSSQTSTYAISATADELVLLSASGGAFTATLPTAVSVTGKRYILKKTDSTFNVVTIATTSSQTIDGVIGTTLNTQNECLEIASDGSNWQIIDRRIPSVWTSYTPTGAWTTNATYTGLWRRVGPNIEVQAKIAVAGALGGGSNGTVTLPSGFSADTTRMLFLGNTIAGVGQGYYADTSTTLNYDIHCYIGSAAPTIIGLGIQSIASHTGTVYPNDENFTLTAPAVPASGDSYGLVASMPIVGWNG